MIMWINLLNSLFVLSSSTEVVEPWMCFVWLGIFVIAIIVEFATTELVSFWFAGGALFALIASLIPGVPYWGEVIVFVASSTILLFSLRPITKKLLSKKEIKSNVDEMIGKKALVIKKIDELNRGEIKIYGVVWTAEASDSKVSIEKDSIVEILAIEGNRVIVKKVD